MGTTDILFYFNHGQSRFTTAGSDYVAIRLDIRLNVYGLEVALAWFFLFSKPSNKCLAKDRMDFLLADTCWEDLDLDSKSGLQ